MIGVSSPVFSLVDFEMAMAFIDQHFDAWEVMGEGRHLLPGVEERFHEAAPSFDLEFSAHAPMSDVNIGSLNPDVRREAVDQVIEGMRAADRMGMRTYTFHPGFWSPMGMLGKERVYEVTHESIARIDEEARDLSINVALENMPANPFTMCAKPGELDYFLEGTDIGVCFDIGHAHVSGTVDRFMERSPSFTNIHIHDNTGQGDEHLPVGEGAIDFSTVLQALDGYRGNLIIESKSLPEALRGKENLQAMMA
ncbi:MAG: sugar phosphate isomerase/epimerase family protein [Methanomassiliicoccales archaeon]